jgi:hypothetical protein
MRFEIQRREKILPPFMLSTEYLEVIPDEPLVRFYEFAA